MKAQAKAIRIQYDSQMMPEIVMSLTSRECLNHLEDLKTATDKGKALDVEIKPHRERRSLDANAYFWTLCGQIAAVLRTDKDSMYLQLLKRYGQYTYIIVKPEAVEKTLQAWRLMEEIGKTKDEKGVQMLAYFGSSTYDAAEFSRLLDGTISEAKELGIEVVSESEKRLMLSERE